MTETGTRRTTMLGLLNIMLLTAFAVGTVASEERTDQAGPFLEEIARSENVADDVMNGDELRSRALDETIVTRSELLKLETLRQDPRRPMWLTDQTETLLLKRIEFPTSWSTHLMVAHPSCPLLPPDIPLIVARGIQEILEAEATIDAAIERVESKEAFDRDATLISLHERLIFERDLRIPLLKAIGLSLAARTDPASGREAVEILRSMRDRTELQDEAREIVDHWFRQALLATGDGAELRAASDQENLDAIEDRIRGLREVALLQGSDAAKALGVRMIRELDRTRGYEKLLLADIIEQAATTDDPPDLDTTGRSPWKDGAGDAWIMLLDESSGHGDWSLDGPLAARLADLEEVHGRKDAPLAVLWAAGQKELAARSRDLIGQPDMLNMLRDASLTAEVDEPARARTLETAARIALLEDERLEASALCEILYREHPDHPFGGPALVADLTEPWARAGHEEATRRYEEALETLIENANPDDGGNDVDGQTLRLAEHYLRRNRPRKSRTLLDSFRPTTKEEAARYLDVRLREVDLIRELETLSDEMVEIEYDLLLRTVDRVVGEFGPSDTGIQTAAARARIASLKDRTPLLRDPQSIGVIERIIEREDIPAATRIDALFLRHGMKLARMSERRDALENRPELVRAIEIDPALAGSALAVILEKRLSRLNDIRYSNTRSLEQERIVEDIRSLTALTDTGILDTLSMMEKVMIGRSLNEIGAAGRSIRLWRKMAEQQPDAWVVMRGHADALALSEDLEDLGEAMRLYRRLGQNGPGDNVPKDVWWNAQLGQLLMMEKADRSTERIPTRIQRLRLIDPDLGGRPFRSEFESLLQRMTQKS
ncbi:MAG TPA: hypothetical protein DCX60_03495 [Phycisphaerales bacterium]|nr:hypothetical protein [Phycisphaerales bacterium]